MRAKRLTMQQKREIFQHLVETQDSRAMSVSDSYRHTGEQYGITEDQVRAVADEGLAKEWPPLGDFVEEEVSAG